MPTQTHCTGEILIMVIESSIKNHASLTCTDTTPATPSPSLLVYIYPVVWGPREITNLFAAASTEILSGLKRPWSGLDTLTNCTQTFRRKHLPMQQFNEKFLILLLHSLKCVPKVTNQAWCLTANGDDAFTWGKCHRNWYQMDWWILCSKLPPHLTHVNDLIEFKCKVTLQGQDRYIES